MMFGRRKHPKICFADSEDSQNGETRYMALYKSSSNELLLTCWCEESDIVPALVHELTHWAQTLGMSRHEISIENMVYEANMEKFGPDVWLAYSIIEKMADWVETECLKED